MRSGGVRVTCAVPGTIKICEIFAAGTNRDVRRTTVCSAPALGPYDGRVRYMSDEIRIARFAHPRTQMERSVCPRV